MKRLPFPFIFLICLILLTSCANPFPKVISFGVSPFVWGNNLDRDYAYALAPDGNSLVLRGLVQINLLTGEENYPFAAYTSENVLLNPIPISWSADGRYLAFSDVGPHTITFPIYLADIKTNSVSRVGGDIQNYLIFSPFQDHTFIAETPIGSSMFKVGDLTATPLGDPLNYSQLSGFGSTRTGFYSYLWSKDLGKPVAQLELLPRPTGENADSITRILYLVSYYTPVYPRESDMKNLVDTGYSMTNEKWLYYFFDPTGEYVLVVELECIGDKPWQCESLDSGYFTDTIFTLIRWKTKEQKEIFRLSSIDSQHALASSLIAWSADGSTLVVGRRNAPAVFFKIKYP